MRQFGDHLVLPSMTETLCVPETSLADMLIAFWQRFSFQHNFDGFSLFLFFLSENFTPRNASENSQTFRQEIRNEQEVLAFDGKLNSQAEKGNTACKKVDESFHKFLRKKDADFVL